MHKAFWKEPLFTFDNRLDMPAFYITISKNASWNIYMPFKNGEKKEQLTSIMDFKKVFFYIDAVRDLIQ